MASHPAARDAELSSGSDAPPAAAPGWSTRRALGGAAVACLACAGGGFAARRLVDGRLPEELERDLSLLQVLAKPRREDCAATTDDCFQAACCDVAGYTCFVTDTPGKAKCLKNCSRSDGYSCAVPVPNAREPMYLDDAMATGSAMYCFSVYMSDTGSDGTVARPDELGLLRASHDRSMGIFACEKWGIFSDAAGDLKPGVPFVAVDDVDGDFHILKRKETGSWVNTGLHTQVWKAVLAAGDYRSADWVVKVDCDAVFLPSRLRPFLASQGVPNPLHGVPGIYLENCKFVKWGWFGNLEIMSLTAADTLFAHIDWCKKTLDWKTGVEGGKYGPMGEDLFAQVCLDSVGVRRGGAFETVLDGACEADRPDDQKKNKKWKPECTEKKMAAYHPLMKVDDFVACYDRTVQAFGY